MVIVGGSLAGLLAARALVGHAGRVTIVERDRFPKGDARGGASRPGVPQGRHPHVLLEGGQVALDALLPGFMAELTAAGAPRIGMPADMAAFQSGRWFRRMPASTHIHTGSRAQIEGLVRRRVLAEPSVTLVEGTETVGLTGDAARVRGVLVRERGDGARGEQREIAADLVIDASGRGTKAPRWLAALGAQAPREEIIDTGLAYASRVYRDTTGTLGDGPAAGTLGLHVVPDPTQPYGAVVVPLEDGTHLATFSGLRGDEPSTDEEEFEAYAERLPHPVVHRWIRDAEPLSPVSGFRRTANVRRRYDLPGRRPAGFLATGDALCTFNPIYGQGMAVAAMGAVALRDALADPRRTPTTRRVQRALLAASRQAWDISAGADKAMPGAIGNAVAGRPVDRVAGWYLRRVRVRVPGDPVVGRAFRSVVSLKEPLSALLAPEVARAVLFGPVKETPAEPPMTRE
ncbi:monooxygenase [Streptomyces sp. VNUA24]|uniref:monooxygenase n=1 Tax=Streptomyces sp. VNUA24 TaxID=3031131 RepID=UPI0023B7A5B8|nr:monooxygenase [Streptomyces sp. VNUA24]WEH20171.1 monooxygenase [Streptomyces sp. VNUA24]